MIMEENLDDNVNMNWTHIENQITKVITPQPNHNSFTC